MSKSIQVKMAMAGLNITVRDLALITGVSTTTIMAIRDGKSVQTRNLDTIIDLLTSRGANFIGNNGVIIDE